MTTTNIFTGAWKNEYGSVLKIKIHENAIVEGEFCTNVGREETQDRWKNSWFKVTGFINNALISFITNYDSTGGLCCSIGRLERRSQEYCIRVQGHFMSEISPDQAWRQTVATSSTFIKLD